MSRSEKSGSRPSSASRAEAVHAIAAFLTTCSTGPCRRPPRAPTARPVNLVLLDLHNPRCNARKPKRVHHVRGTAATRLMSLRCSSSHATLSAGEGDQVQLFDLPAPWRTLGVLRVRNSSDRRTSGEYGRVHLGRQDAAECALQDLRVCHALGTTCSRARRQTWRQSEQF